MKRVLLVTLFAILPIMSRAADIVNGWSAQGTIIKIHSVYSYTYFKLSSSTNGCGHPEFWALPVADTPSNKVKHSILLSAFAGGKTVSLRCENSQMSDFEIYD
jgi:hypothetical protein